VKRKIPVAVWQKVQPLIDKNNKLFKPVRTDKYALLLEDIIEESDFYFRSGLMDSSDRFPIEYKPVSMTDIKAVTETVNLETLAARIVQWADVLKAYEETPTFYDDPIEKQYEDEFYAEIEILEPDADTKPFNFPQQLIILKYVEIISNILLQVDDNISEDDNYQLRLIEADCRKLHDNITIIPKNEALRKLAKIWAKCRKYSIDLILQVLRELKKEGIKTLVESVFKGEVPFANLIGENIDKLPS
jgi:hypothetical protein